MLFEPVRKPERAHFLSGENRQIVIWILAAKLVVLLSTFLAFQFGTFHKEQYLSQFVYPTSEITWHTAYRTWDACHWLYIADHGFAKGSNSNVLFPLFPAAIALAKKIVFGNGLLSGLAVSNLFSFFGFIYLFKYVREKYDLKMAWNTLAYALAFPTSFFFTRVYSESLFFFLCVLLFYALSKKKVFKAAICGFFLPLARPTGILIELPVVVYALIDFKSKTGQKEKSVFKYFYVVSPLLGFALNLLLMKVLTGNWFEQFDGQRHFAAGNSISNIFNLQKWFFENFVFVNWAWYGDVNNIMDRLFFLFYLWLLFKIAKKRDLTMFSFCLVMGLIPALSDHFMGYMRYLIVIFPLYIQLATEPFYHKRIQATMFLCQLTFNFMHSLSYWVS